uniref:Uncharacterized protein n=1 Tax=viral metagenome TaxID=1070528 RepID=A0A6C0B344_9ZZZZ
MGSTQTAYEALLMENHGGELAKKLRTKEISNPMRRFAAAVAGGRQYDDIFGESVLIIPDALKQRYKDFLKTAIREVKEDVERDMTPSNSQNDLNATMSSDPGVGGRRRRTRKTKKLRRKTRKHRR